jgi:hypothetical protein
MPDAPLRAQWYSSDQCVIVMGGVDELHVDADAIAGAANTVFQNGRNIRKLYQRIGCFLRSFLEDPMTGIRTLHSQQRTLNFPTESEAQESPLQNSEALLRRLMNRRIGRLSL